MTEAPIDRLRSQFRGDGISFFPIDSGPAIRIVNDGGMVEVALHGAHVLRWIPAGGDDVLFMSERAIYRAGVPLRGGIPVCWPWFNDHPADNEVYSHGFARRQLWQVSAVEGTPRHSSVRLTLSGVPGDFPAWPHAFEVELSVILEDSLCVSLTARNTDRLPVTISAALHTYFGVSDVRRVSIEGLDGSRYVDDVDGGVTKTQQGPVVIDGEVDRVHVDTDASVVLTDPLAGRRIRIVRRAREAVSSGIPGRRSALP